jgi:hypothetical protein
MPYEKIVDLRKAKIYLKRLIMEDIYPLFYLKFNISIGG